MLQNTQEIQKTHDITEKNKPKQQNFTDICDKFHVEQTLLRQTKFNKFKKMGMIPGIKKYRPDNNPKQLNLLDKQEIKEQFKESTEKIESVLDFYKDYYLKKKNYFLKKKNYIKTNIERKNQKEEKFDFFNKIKEVLNKNDEISKTLEHEISNLNKIYNNKINNFSDLVNFIDNLAICNKTVLSIYSKLGVRINNMNLLSGCLNSKLSLRKLFKYSLMLGYEIDINIKFNKDRYKKLLDKKAKLDDYVRIENPVKGQMTYKFLNKKLFNM